MYYWFSVTLSHLKCPKDTFIYLYSFIFSKEWFIFWMGVTSNNSKTNNYHKLQNKIYYFLRCVWQLPSNRTKSWFVAWHGCVMTFAFSYLFVHFYFCYPFLFKKYCSTKGSLSFKLTSFITQSDCFSFRLFVHALVYQSFRELSNKDTPWFMFLNKITELYQSF